MIIQRALCMAPSLRTAAELLNPTMDARSWSNFWYSSQGLTSLSCSAMKSFHLSRCRHELHWSWLWLKVSQFVPFISNLLKNWISGTVDGQTLPRHNPNALDIRTSLWCRQATHSRWQPMAVSRRMQVSYSIGFSCSCVKAHASHRGIALSWLQKVENCDRCCLSWTRGQLWHN